MRDTSNKLHRQSLAYVQWFSKFKHTTEDDINMYEVSRDDTPGLPRSGEVIFVESILRFVQLIPKFGPNVNALLNSENSADICRDFYVNSFADKEIYQAVW